MSTIISVLMGMSVLLGLMLAFRKRYKVSVIKMISLYAVVTALTILGANFGSAIGGFSWKGLRLYGILMVDTVALFAMSWLFRMEIGSLGDYLAAPVIGICSIVKIPCLCYGCCYGIELYKNAAGDMVRFPSQFVEFSIWLVLTVWLVLIQFKGNHKNLIWSIATAWFGFLRFLVDFFRGSALEMRLRIFGLPAGRFWSLVVLAMGIAFMFYSFRKYWGRNPKLIECLRILVGVTPVKEN
jgi:prolipoprotein diacylglyceryltransferase